GQHSRRNVTGLRPKRLLFGPPRGVAQPGSALRSGRRGPQFKSGDTDWMRGNAGSPAGQSTLRTRLSSGYAGQDPSRSCSDDEAGRQEGEPRERPASRRTGRGDRRRRCRPAREVERYRRRRRVPRDRGADRRGRVRQRHVRVGPRPWDHARRWLDRRVSRRAREAFEHEPRVRPRRPHRRHVPEDPSLRRGGRRGRVSRVRGGGGRGRARRGEGEEPGEDAVVADVEDWRIGLSICYDVRFPELYRILTLEGAQLVTVPAHFTTPKGKDHWHVLLRARAIENQLYVVAAAQIGETLPGKPAYGRSLIADPWGVVVAQAPDEATVITAELDRPHLQNIRAKLPSLANRQPNAYRW